MKSSLASGLSNTIADARELVLQGVTHFNTSNLKAPGIWVLLAFSSVSSIFAYDLSLNQVRGNPNFWLLALAQLVYLAIYALAAFTLKPGSKNRAWYFATALTLMVLSRAWVLELAFHPEIEDVFTGFLRRLPGDTSITFVLFYIANEFAYSNENHQMTLRLLQQSKESLHDKQIEAKKSALEIDDSLSAMAREVLSDPLNKLRNKLSGTSHWEEIRAISTEIRELINSQVRPLGLRLRNRIQTLDSTRELTALARPVRWRIPKNLNAERDLDLLTVFLVAMPNIWITANTLGTWRLLLLSLAVSPLVLIVGSWVRPRLQVFQPKNLAGNWLLTTVILFLSFVPMQILFLIYSRFEPEATPLRISGMGVFIVIGTMFTLWAAVEVSRRELETEVASLNLEIARETGIVEQQIWLARKKWAYLIHGTVQGALTVAASRLQLADANHPADINRILGDLDKAAKALTDPVSDHESFQSLIREIRETWDGVLNIEVAVSKYATQVIKQPLTERCLAEIIKELAGNAYRHGEAKRLYVNIELDENSDIKLTASNDGKLSLQGTIAGMGSQLFDDLTMKWTRTQDEAGVNFSAVLPAIHPRSDSNQALAEL